MENSKYLFSLILFLKICFTICLTESLISFDLKSISDVVNKFTLKDIINASWDEYCADNADNNDFEDGPSPQR